MSTENNSDLLFKNSVKILTDLISFKTISGEDNTALIDYCDDILKKLGATSFRTYDDEKKRVNLFATLKAKSSNNKKPIRHFITLTKFRFNQPRTNRGTERRKFVRVRYRLNNQI